MISVKIALRPFGKGTDSIQCFMALATEYTQSTNELLFEPHHDVLPLSNILELAVPKAVLCYIKKRQGYGPGLLLAPVDMLHRRLDDLFVVSFNDFACKHRREKLSIRLRRNELARLSLPSDGVRRGA